jgi:hypothetical protein
MKSSLPHRSVATCCNTNYKHTGGLVTVRLAEASSALKYQPLVRVIFPSVC